MKKLDLLKDPCGDRQNTSMALPSAKPIPTERLFPEGDNGRIDIDLLGQHLLREGKLTKKDFMTLLKRIDKIFDEEPNLLYLYDPITIVGDIHGQFYDLMHMFSLKKTGWENKKYLFLGDYVDRGMWSIEVLIYLYALKITYPKQIYLLRGNHESRECTANFNFRIESVFKYDQEVYEEVCETFDVLPLAAIVNGRFCCVHGGISPEIYKIQDLEKIDRKEETPMNGIGCDIVWSDPTEDDRGHVRDTWEFNQSRGCSYVYGYAAVREFLKVNKLACLIRAHEVQNDGYKCHVWGDEGFPQVLTIFSAPNYCGTYGNRAGVITLENGVLNIEQYNTSGSPFLLPDFKNSFTWSIPFITEKVCELFRNLVTQTDSSFHWELDAIEEEGFNKLFQTGELNQFLVGADQRSRLDSIDEMVNRTKSESRESIAGLNIINLNGEILTPGQLKNKNANERYVEVRNTDVPNEMRPLFSNSPLKQGKNAYQYIESPGKLRQNRRSTLDRLSNDLSLYKQFSSPDSTYVDPNGDRYNLYNGDAGLCYIDKNGVEQPAPQRGRKTTS